MSQTLNEGARPYVRHDTQINGASNHSLHIRMLGDQLWEVLGHNKVVRRRANTNGTPSHLEVLGGRADEAGLPVHGLLPHSLCVLFEVSNEAFDKGRGGLYVLQGSNPEAMRTLSEYSFNRIGYVLSDHGKTQMFVRECGCPRIPGFISKQLLQH